MAAPTSVLEPATYGPPNPSAVAQISTVYSAPTEYVTFRANPVSSATARYVSIAADPRARDAALPSDATAGWSWDTPVSIERKPAPKAGTHFSAAFAVHASPRRIRSVAVGRAAREGG